jgi:hypothetical protein
MKQGRNNEFCNGQHMGSMRACSSPGEGVLSGTPVADSFI